MITPENNLRDKIAKNNVFAFRVQTDNYFLINTFSFIRIIVYRVNDKNSISKFTQFTLVFVINRY